MSAMSGVPVAQRKQQAIALLQAGRVVEAKEIFEGLSRDARRDPDVWHLLAACHCMLGDDKQGEVFARKAVALMPSFSGAWVNLGSALLGQHKLTEAVGALREAIKCAPTDAQAHSNLGNVYREMKKTDEAEKCYRDALRLQPNYPDALTNLGLIMQDRGKLEQAMSLHRRALDLNRHHVDALYNLGYALMLQGDAKSACPLFERVTQLQPSNARGWSGLGNASARLHDRRRAAQCYERAVALNPSDAENLSALGVCYLTIGEREKSAAALTRALELKPDDADTRYWLAAAGVGEAPESMSAKAVARLFDGYAGHFDEHLVGKLQYRTPALIGAALRRAREDRAQSMTILDLGCGTGLMGGEIKDIAAYLAGVDLSPKMIERARTRGLYDELAVGDITEYMETSSRHFDAIVSADVFVYLGKIDQVFAATSVHLSPAGLFAFSVEAHTGDGPFELRSSGRYAHALSYLRELAREHGFSEVSAEEVTLRLENNAPIAGYVMVLRRS